MYIYNNKITTIRLSVEGCEAICTSFPYTLTPFWDPWLPNGPPVSSIELECYSCSHPTEKTVQNSSTPVNLTLPLTNDVWNMILSFWVHIKKSGGHLLNFGNVIRPIYIYIYISGTQMTPVFIAKGLLFGGLNPQNRGQTSSSVYIYIYIWNQSRKQINGVSWFPQ